MSHKVQILKNDREADELEWEVDGECDKWCKVYYPCKEDTCLTNTDDESLEDKEEVILHGVLHKNLDIGWAVKSNHCVTSVADNFCEYIDEHPVGVYDLDIDYQGDGIWYFTFTPEGTLNEA